ncbi:unnamed protein product [Spirodela intermedia]|uniref:Uncharacterized protein n=1 Tax=Spirodela intermedia TaxID=51605 RepID=A0A7I8J3C8_SPIIN|nr:unnamed protein product [Spirodela intermedia]CAA6664746.1 unnamed protein product [Spirodela intermedia]
MAPLQLESPTGQFLSQILISHPHLLSAAVDQQLEQLQTDRDAEKEKEPSDSGTDIVLYKRISEVKANERKRALQEILYTLVVQKFMDADVSLIPGLSQSSDPSGRVDQWPPQEDELRKLHSPEAYEMIQNHLALILGNRLGDASAVAPISKFRVGQVYAASVMYGYFLKRVDQRFRLEKTMQTLPWGSEEEESTLQQEGPYEVRPSVKKMRAHTQRLLPGRLLKSALTLQQCATIRSKEALGLIERHTEALFGRPASDHAPGSARRIEGRALRDQLCWPEEINSGGRNVRSFLWDVESYVDSRHHIVAN